MLDTLITVMDVLFYFLPLYYVTSAMMVISARNPVHSVLFLIFRFLMPQRYSCSSVLNTRDDADHRLCRRGGGVVLIRGYDAQY